VGSDGRRYDLVSDKACGVALEPTITTTVQGLRAERGGGALTQTRPWGFAGVEASGTEVTRRRVA
jgi:hypothetical protein